MRFFFEKGQNRSIVHHHQVKREYKTGYGVSHDPSEAIKKKSCSIEIGSVRPLRGRSINKCELCSCPVFGEEEKRLPIFTSSSSKMEGFLVTYPPENEICTYIEGRYLFIIIKKRKGRAHKPCPFGWGNCTGFFILIFYDFLQLSERGSNENRLQKRKRERYPPQRVGNTKPPYLPIPTSLTILLALSLLFLSSTFSCIYIYLHTPSFSQKKRY